MNGTAVRVPGLVLAFVTTLVAAGCAAPPADDAPRLRVRIHPELPEFSFTLVGESAGAPPGTLRVRKIEIRRGSASDPAQVIGDLDTATPVSDAAPGIEVLDMNFDGYGDLRIVEFLPAGPDVPYLNWLFDPESGRFAPSPELDRISRPIFEPETRRIRSEWRDGPTRYGNELYEVIDGRPVAVEKEIREYTEPGVYTLTRSRRVEGTWEIVERRQVRE